MSYHIKWYQIILYHIMSYHIISYHILSYHIKSHRSILCHIISSIYINTDPKPPCFCQRVGPCKNLPAAKRRLSNLCSSTNFLGSLSPKSHFANCLVPWKILGRWSLHFLLGDSKAKVMFLASLLVGKVWSYLCFHLFSLPGIFGRVRFIRMGTYFKKTCGKTCLEYDLNNKNTPRVFFGKTCVFLDSPKKWNFIRPAEKIFHTSKKVWAFDQKKHVWGSSDGKCGNLLTF